jgi:hypothetical protein
LLEGPINHRQTKGFADGPAISDKLGKACTSRMINDCLQEIFEDLFEDPPSLFPATTPDKKELRKRFQMLCTLRKTSDTPAIEMRNPKMILMWLLIG